MKRLIVCFLLLTVLAMAGCSPRVKPDETVKNFLDAMVNSDFETAVKFTGGVNPEYELDRILVSAQTLYGSAQSAIEHSVLGHVTYEVGSVEIKGDKAVVRAKITAPDCKKVFHNALQSILLMHSVNPSVNTTTYMHQIFNEGVSASDAPMTVSDVVITLDKKNGSWVIALRGDDELLNALTGNMANPMDL
ncbi:MAG: hypothetical protein AB9886_02025 [Candidatus Cryosericum sp.]